MKLPHKKSSQCLRSELDIFSLPPTQTAVEQGQWVEYNPVSTYSSSAPLEFIVTGSGDEYIDLQNTLLKIVGCVKESDGTPSTANTAAAPINNTIHSLFSQLDISLNDVSITSASTTYPYRSYIETHLNYGDEAKHSRLSAGLYFKDNNITQSDPKATSGKIHGLVKRHSICTAKNSFDMIGTLHSDIFYQNRYLVNGVTMKLKLSRSKDKFVMMGDGKIDILSAKLNVRNMKITPSLILAHEKLLEIDSAKYPISRVECKVIHLPRNQKSISHDNLFLGQIPKRLVLGIVDNMAFNGDYSLNPFEFKHANVNYLSLHLDGRQIPCSPLQPSFDEHNYVRAYYTQFTGGDRITSDTGNGIGRLEFKDGHSLYCFDLTPDLSSSCGHHFSVAKTGNLRIEIGFDSPLTFTGNLIVYAEFENVIEIDKDRKVTSDYGN